MRGARLAVREPTETGRGLFSALQLLDLDADGLPEIVLGSAGYEDEDAPGSRIWRNLGDFRFERVALPASLALPADGAPLLPLDVDGDGRLDLLQLSANDRERLAPDHRGWLHQGQVAHRQWPLRLTLPGGLPLPYGTRIEATAPRPWLAVLREEEPLHVPDWVQDQLLVVTPDGRIRVAELGQGLRGPRHQELEPVELPALLGPGQLPLTPGTALSDEQGLAFRALGQGWELELWAMHRSAELVQRRDGEELRQLRPARTALGLGCGWNGRCRLQRQAPEGGYRILELDPLTGEERQLGEPGDMLQDSARGAGRLWSASSARIWERDPATYAPLHPDLLPDPRLKCHGLAFDGEDLGCCSWEGGALAAYDPDSLKARWRLDLPVPQGCDLQPASGGWLVTQRDGLAWVDGEGRLTAEHWLGGQPLLVAHEDGLWAILEHRVLWLDTAGRRIVGGMVVPNALRALPVPPGGELWR